MTDWNRIWSGSGIGAVLFLIVAAVLYGGSPGVGASADKLVSFYDGDRTRILIATVIFCLGFLNLLWFAAALSTDLRDEGKGGWATAVTASSAALAAVLFARMAVRAALAFSIAGSGREEVTSGLSDLGWVLSVIVSFPAAMFVMAGSFGLWRAGIISKAAFGAGVAAVVLVLLGGTTWARDGFWAPDGAYAIVSGGIIFFAWIAVVSGFLVIRRPSAARAPERAAVPAA
jgi:hypothetical protein